MVINTHAGGGDAGIQPNNLILLTLKSVMRTMLQCAFS
jgi:hypothetical protein